MTTSSAARTKRGSPRPHRLALACFSVAAVGGVAGACCGVVVREPALVFRGLGVAILAAAAVAVTRR